MHLSPTPRPRGQALIETALLAAALLATVVLTLELSRWWHLRSATRLAAFQAGRARVLHGGGSGAAGVGLKAADEWLRLTRATPTGGTRLPSPSGLGGSPQLQVSRRWRCTAEPGATGMRFCGRTTTTAWPLRYPAAMRISPAAAAADTSP